MERFDVVIAGGGIAGSTAAAALARNGHRVLLCEAGLPNAKRLAGELLHPPGAAHLEAVGLLEPLRAAGAVPVYGFSVFRSADDPGTVLSYSEIRGGRPMGVALEHAKLTRTLFGAAGAVEGVTLWEGARVLDADLERREPAVTVRYGDETLRVGARLVVSAEGRRSPLRERAGIESIEEPPFRMLGWKIPGARLPYPGYGHVFVGGPSPILAYQMSKTEARIMFEVGLDQDLAVEEALLAALPRPFRDDVERAIANEPRATARFSGFRPSRVTGPSLAVVGDAGGCVHPLIASGMSFCAADAVRLANAFPWGTTVADALRSYEASRRGPMRTRAALGPAMVEALCSDSPEMRLLRHGLFRYWGRSSRGRGTSMGLLSTRESSMAVMAREYAIVCANALTGLPRGVVRSDQLVPAVVGLARRTAGFLRTAVA